MDAYWTWAPYSHIWPKVPSPLSFLYFIHPFLCYFALFVLFVYFSLSLNWKTLYFKSPLTKRSPASFSRSNSEVDFCPFVSCLERKIQYWSLETKYSVLRESNAHYAKEWLNILELRSLGMVHCSEVKQLNFLWKKASD